MTRQELTAQLAGLQQKRLALAAKLDKETLQLQLWDTQISLLQEMLATLQTQGEQEEKRVQLVTAEAKMSATTPIVQAAKTITSLGV